MKKPTNSCVFVDRLRHFGNTTWKEIVENREVFWNIGKKMIEERKVRNRAAFQFIGSCARYLCVKRTTINGCCFFSVQAELDPENPECVLDGLILQQMKEFESSGKAEIFTDDALNALTYELFEAGTMTVNCVKFHDN